MTGVKPTSSSSSTDEEQEEVIRCVCGMYCDEGKMVQCENCEVCMCEFDVVNIDNIAALVGVCLMILVSVITIVFE